MSSLEVTRTVVPWSGGAQARPLDRGAAVERLPGSVELDPFERLAMAFLVGYTDSTARAYLVDLKTWAAACAQMGTHPFDARRHHVDAWVRTLSAELLARTNKPMAPASIARRLSAVSAFYDYGISVDVLDFSPVANVRRPKVSEDSTTVGLSAEEAVTLLDAADAHSLRLGALVSLLTYNGVRIDEALAADVTGLHLSTRTSGAADRSQGRQGSHRPSQSHHRASAGCVHGRRPPHIWAAVPRPDQKQAARLHHRLRDDPTPGPQSGHPGC